MKKQDAKLKKQVTPRYSKKDIANTLNNAVIMTGNPHSHNKALNEENGRRLQAVTIDMLQPYMDYIQEGIVSAEEVVFALSAAALFVHMTKIMETDKLPIGVELKKFINMQKKAKIPPMEIKCPHCKEQVTVA